MVYFGKWMIWIAYQGLGKKRSIGFGNTCAWDRQFWRGNRPDGEIGGYGEWCRGSLPGRQFLFEEYFGCLSDRRRHRAAWWQSRDSVNL